MGITADDVLSGSRTWSVTPGDCLAQLATLPANSIDAMVTDPPAGIGFMGKAWDGAKGGRGQWVAWLTTIMAEAFRVLKPGAHALVWALPRTSHWTAWALEDAGFEVRDKHFHIFGSGFPKSMDVSKAIDRMAGAPATEDAQRWQGWGTALKPAVEEWILVRKPMRQSVAKNVLEHGTGALNIDGCRVPHASAADLAAHTAGVDAIKARGGTMDNSWANHSDLSGASDVSSAGRWPSHLLLSHALGCKCVGTFKVKAPPPWGDVRGPSLFTGVTTSPVHHTDADGFETLYDWDCVDGCPVRELDAQSGDRPGAVSNGVKSGNGYGGKYGEQAQAPGYADDGGASRYFTTFPPFLYTPKCDRADREKGCEHLPQQVINGDTPPGSLGSQSPRAGAGRTGKRRNHHPTVKSTDLMRWLVRLITPPGGIVLDPFAGSGSTGVACSAERLRFIGFELDPEYVEIARARIIGDAPLLNVGGL
jgi:hypothetical protein